jgi:hypothetical protein
MVKSRKNFASYCQQEGPVVDWMKHSDSGGQWLNQTRCGTERERKMYFDVPVEIRIGLLPNTSQKRPSYSQIAWSTARISTHGQHRLYFLLLFTIVHLIRAKRIYEQYAERTSNHAVEIYEFGASILSFKALRQSWTKCGPRAACGSQSPEQFQ